MIHNVGAFWVTTRPGSQVRRGKWTATAEISAHGSFVPLEIIAGEGSSRDSAMRDAGRKAKARALSMAAPADGSGAQPEGGN